MEVAVSQFRSICQNRSLISSGLGILFLLALTPYWSQVFGGSYVVSLVDESDDFCYCQPVV